jgi:Zn-dependent protease
MLFSILLNGSGNLVVNLFIFVLVAVSLIISISIHEFAHAYAAYKLGDSTAKSMGRLTLNPKAHLDPTGTLLLLIAGFGWGKPVPFDPRLLKNPKRDAAIISFAGPASNFLLAITLSILFHVFSFGGLIGLFLSLVVQYNLVLAVFNLIPVNPLDGFKVVNGFLPRELSYQWIQLAPYGMWILLALIFAGVTDKILGPILDTLLTFLGF